MHETLASILEELEALADAAEDSLPDNEPLAISQNNWSFPAISRSEIRQRIDRSYDLIETFGTDSLKGDEKLLADYPRRISYLRANALPQMPGSAPAVISAIFVTLEALDQAVASSLDRDPNTEAIKRIRLLNKRLQSRQDQLDEIGPKVDELKSMVERIEDAHEAADKLPTDLKSLRDARARVAGILTEIEADRKKTLESSEAIEKLKNAIEGHRTTAESVLQRCETAYSAATSVGLAAAFSERSKSLGLSVWVWTGLLIVSLAIAGLLGFWRIQALATTLADTTASDARTFLQFLLSILSVGAPIWFAWLATRQIGQRFRIAEDYAFKAAVSRAYEGYRREAARIDEDLEIRLLGSALSRMDEQPLRLVEHTSPSSPIAELTSSKLIQNALRIVPGFADDVKDLAARSLDVVERVTKGEVGRQPSVRKRNNEEDDVVHEDGDEG